MIPTSRLKISQQLNLGKLKGKELIANFDGGIITSDAGIVLIAELDEKLKITARFAECFQDHRNLSYINYGSSLLFMLNQQTRCQDNILLTQKFRKFLKP